MRKWAAFLGVAALAVAAFLAFSYWYMVMCAGEWHGRPMEEGKTAELASIKNDLERDVAFMQGLGPRNSESPAAYAQLLRCADWVRERWRSQGYIVREQRFAVDGREYANLEVELPGRTIPSEVVIVSAQYDTLPGSPGANNNASGMAMLLKLGEMLKGYAPHRTLRLVAFVNEEDPFFGTDKMGSYQYAKRSREAGEDIRAMLSLDALGIYTDRPNSQRLPFPFSVFYPDRGNFLAFIGDLGSRGSIVEATRGFRKGSSFPIEAGAVPRWAEGAAWSDQSSFWNFGYPGIMVTDTGGFRSAYHTTSGDTMEKIDFTALARITMGMYAATVELTRKGI